MKKKHPEHVNLERWLVSYADFITLMFAFFVVMYAISQADLSKFKRFTVGVRNAFSTEPVGMVDLAGNAGGNTANPLENPDVLKGRLMDLPSGKTNVAAETDPQLQEIRELMEESISLQLGTAETSEKLRLQYDSRGLVVRISANDFFDEGAREVKQDLLPVVDKIGAILSKTNRVIQVEGHSDVLEEKETRYANGWELSAARAAWVLEYWKSRHDFAGKKLTAAGCSHFRPLTDSVDPLVRAKNRRVEFIIMNNRYESP